MPFCPNCRGEFQDWVTDCPDCSVPLVDTLAPEPPKPPKPEKLRPDDTANIITAARFSYPAEAHLAAAKLESEGIPAFVADEHTVIANWMYSGALGGVKVWVKETDLEAARQVLDYREPPSLEKETEACPACGSEDIHYETFSIRPMFITWLITALTLGGGFTLPFTKRKWVCRACGHRWREGKNGTTDKAGGPANPQSQT